MATQTDARDSQLLLDEPEIRLEGEELIVPGWRFNLGEIEATRVDRVATAATGPILMIAIGAICLLSITGEGGLMRGLLGAGLLAGAAVWWTWKKPFYKVVLGLGESEATAFESTDEAVARRVLTAIEKARER